MKKVINFFSLAILTGLIIRIIANVFYGFALNVSGDDIQYQSIAEHLLRGIYSLDGLNYTAIRSPLFPFIIAFLFKIFGVNYILPRLFLMVIDTLIALVIYQLGSKLFNQRVGFWSSLFWLFNPLAIYYTFFYTIDILLLFLLLLVVNAVLDKMYLKAFIWLGLAALTKSIAFYLAPVLLLYLFVIKVDFRKILIGLVFLLLIMSPWLIYNRVAMGQWNFGDNGVGVVLWGANNSTVVTGTWTSIYGFSGYAEYAQLPELARNKFALTKAVDYMQSVPYWHWPLIMTMRLFYFWNFIPALAENFHWRNLIVGLFSFGWTLPFFIMGIKKYFNKPELLFVWMYIIYFNLIAVATYGSLRMRMPITPLVIIIAFAILFDLLKKYKLIK